MIFGGGVLGGVVGVLRWMSRIRFLIWEIGQVGRFIGHVEDGVGMV